MGEYLTKIDVFFCGLLALACMSSSRYVKTGDCPIDGAYVLSAIALFLFLMGINIIIRKGISLYYEKKTDKVDAIDYFCRRIFESEKSLLKTAGIIFLCWLPVLIALYPGTFINDTWGQVQQFMAFTDGGTLHKGVLSDHHPFFDTFVIGGFIVPLVKLTGAWHVVIFAYVLIQAMITSLVYGYSVLYVYRKLKIGVAATVGILVFYCIMPIYAASAQTVSKDALFAWIYVLFFVGFMEIIRTNGDALKGRHFFIKFIGTIILCILTKKVGFYVISGSLCILLIFRMFDRKKIAICLAVALVMMGGVLPLTRHAMGIHAGGKQEMMSMPFQQTARYVKYNPDDITPYEKETIDKILRFDDLGKRYDPIISDPVKGYSQKWNKHDFIKYVGVWFNQGFRHPGTYIDGFNAMVAGWFSFSEYKPLLNMGWHNQLNPKMIPEWIPVRNDFSKWTATSYEAAYDMLYHTPFFMIFLCIGLYAALIPAFMVATVCRKHKGQRITYWLVAIPMALNIMLGCWLSPCSAVHLEGMRYLYPIIYTTPLIVAWCLFFYKNKIESEKI